MEIFCNVTDNDSVNKEYIQIFTVEIIDLFI
jgi:hypothetical protein